MKVFVGNYNFTKKIFIQVTNPMSNTLGANQRRYLHFIYTPSLLNPENAKDQQ